MKIVIYGNEYQGKYLNDLAKLFSSMSHHHIWVGIEKSFYDYLTRTFPEAPHADHLIDKDSEIGDATLALSIGGDGTFLRTAESIAFKEIPILGINTGHLGYLADMSVNDISSIIEDIIHNRYKIENRTLLEVTTDAGIPIKQPFALNEVSILKQDTSSMISIETSVNGIYLTTYLGDGLIISTPTGSTAYNLSVGGPILEPTSNNWVISPIAPHSLTMRPLVLSDDCTISIKTKSRVSSYRISIDGRSYSLAEGTTITLKKAPFNVKVVHRLNHNFAETLRSKLMWGTDKR